MNWIKTSDTLPELDKWVAIWIITHKIVITARMLYKFDSYTFVSIKGQYHFRLKDISHWAELIEPNY